jgi:arginase family enzyme
MNTRRWLRNPATEALPAAEGLRLRVVSMGVQLDCTPLQASLLDLFATPTSLVDAFSKQPRAKPQRAFLEQCCNNGMLLAVDDDGRPQMPPLLPAREPFMHAPPLAALMNSNVEHAFGFIGVPWDRDTSGRGGARFGPTVVRQASSSWSFAINPLSRVPLGLFDHARQERILEGIGIADLGDVCVLPGDDVATVRARMSRAVAEALANGVVPLVVGGDHSITRPLLGGAVDALDAVGEQTPVCVVHFDAHTDLADLEPGLHHGNVMHHILADLPRVKRLVQVGLRGFSAVAATATPREVHAFGMDQIDLDAILAAIPPDHACWFSIDIDVVDPAFAPATGTPVAGGMMPRELWRLVEQIAAQRLCIGLDLVEVAEPTSAADSTATVAATCLLHFCRGMVRGPTWRTSNGND